jgi:hypothetical protein
VIFLAVAGCEGKQPASSPPPARKDAAVAIDALVTTDASMNPNAGTGEPARRKPPAFALRETPLPQRTPCKADCDDRYPSPKAMACFREAQVHEDINTRPADIMLKGERTHGPCNATSVVIDCCPFKPTDYKGIANKLGWAKATSEERKAIAWVMARVVLGGTIIDADYWLDLPKDLSMPVARDAKGGLVLDYWIAPDGAHSPQFVHEQLTFGEAGDVTVTVLERVNGTLAEPVR